MKIKIHCDMCGIEFERLECYMKGKKHHFCCRQCLADFSSKNKNPNKYLELKNYSKMSKNMSKMNLEMNKDRMIQETRSKLRASRLGKGVCNGYSKIYGKSAHRVIAEQILGRTLKNEEVVHHRDNNRYNNIPENLVVFSSQKEHAKFHAEHRWFLNQIKSMEENDESR